MLKPLNNLTNIQLILPPHPFYFFFRSSSSSSRNQFHNYYLRKRRKWPHPVYKSRWHEKLSQQQAMQALKQSPSTDNLLSSLINSFSLYNCSPTPNSYHFVIKTLIKTSQFHYLPSVLDRLEKFEEFETPESIFVDLIRFYGDLNEFQSAINLFFRIPNFRCDPTVDSLNCLLSGLCKKKEGLDIVPQLLLKSRLMNIRIEESSFCILIKALCRIKKANNAIKLLYHMVDHDIAINGKSFSLILSTLCEQKDLSFANFMGFLGEMRRLGFCLERMDWGNLIRFLVKKGKGMEALKALNQMKLDGIKPDVICYTMALDGVIFEGDFDNAEQVFDEMLVLGLVPDINTYNVYVRGLCKQNKFEAGIEMLACMEEIGCTPNALTYNTLLGAMYESGQLNKARELLKHTKVKGIQLHSRTYEIMIGSLVNIGEIFEGLALLEEMLGNSLIPQPSTLDQMLCGLCQKGLVSKALELLREMVGKNALPGARSWEALIVGFGLKHSFEETSLIDLDRMTPSS